jgi:hypothetical protein
LINKNDLQIFTLSPPILYTEHHGNSSGRLTKTPFETDPRLALTTNKTRLNPVFRRVTFLKQGAFPFYRNAPLFSFSSR